MLIIQQRMKLLGSNTLYGTLLQEKIHVVVSRLIVPFVMELIGSQNYLTLPSYLFPLLSQFTNLSFSSLSRLDLPVMMLQELFSPAS